MSEKPKFAMYWAASCGGCEISVLNIGEKILMSTPTSTSLSGRCIADFKSKM
jgi:F420-non-reducing hydrogenase small subunit